MELVFQVSSILVPYKLFTSTINWQPKSLSMTTAVKARHQINDTESQKFLSRSFIGFDDRRVISSAYASHNISRSRSRKSVDLQKLQLKTSGFHGSYL